MEFFSETKNVEIQNIATLSNLIKILGGEYGYLFNCD